jgi:transcriptional regulator with XRE-family HTH domain
MPRKRASTPDPVSNAVRELRESLSQSQQQFSNTIGVAMNTVARWETTRPPKGKALNDLRELAIENKKTELAWIFGDALLGELGLKDRVAKGLANRLYALIDLLVAGADSLDPHPPSTQPDALVDEPQPSCDLFSELVLEKIREHSGAISTGAARDAVRSKYPKLYARATEELMRQREKEDRARWPGLFSEPNSEDATQQINPKKRSTKK